jgi:acetyltransferase-like isoleucine patch superfamily enzyme
MMRAMDQPPPSGSRYKFKDTLQDERSSAFRAYRKMCHGDVSMGRLVACEVITTLFSGIPGALGLLLRKWFYPLMFPHIGKSVVFGRHLTLRHPHKIRIGDRVILDDNCVIDAKGDSNTGITIEDDVYIGRNSIVYCKNGDIILKKKVNLSSNCQVFSSNRLTIGEGTVIGAYTYLLSGGEYDVTDKETPFADQSGLLSKGELTIGANCWISARVTVLDGATVGDHCVLGAGAVVTEPVPPDSLAVGVPAKVVKKL